MINVFPSSAYFKNILRFLLKYVDGELAIETNLSSLGNFMGQYVTAHKYLQHPSSQLQNSSNHMATL